jgi:hypothetical protein
MSLLKATDVAETPLPQGLIGWWFGTVASIPYGFEVANGQVSVNDPSYTRPNLVGRFPKAVGASGDTPGSTGGGSHSHEMAAHGHTTGGANQCGDPNLGTMATSIPCDHTHTVPSAGPYSLDAASVKPTAVYGVPVVYTLRGTRPTGPRIHDLMADAFPPQKLIGAWSNSATPPAGWAKCDGGTVNGVATPNFLGKYLRGIPNTGTNPGAVSGSNTHSHNLSHWHVTTQGGSHPTQGACCGASSHAMPPHDHNTDSQLGASSAGNHEPAFVTTHYICFVGHGSGAVAHALGKVTGRELDTSLLVPRGLTFIWGHALAEKPSGWSHCDGGGWTAPTGYGSTRPNLLGLFVENTSGDGGGGNGASNSHGHGGGWASHAHGSTSVYYGSVYDREGYDDFTGSDNHAHSGTDGPHWNQDTSATHIPYHQEVAFIVRD